MNEILDFIKFVLDLGGPVVAILAVASFIALTLVIFKLFQFYIFEIGSTKDTQRAINLWQTGQTEPALKLLEQKRGLIARAVCLVLNRLSEDISSDKEQIEDAVQTLAIERLHNLQTGLKALDTIAQLAPLLGLFGTVLGMIDAFKALQGAGSNVDPSILAGGIWVALLTTAVGLAVAMPITIVLSYFETRLENERVSVEVLVGSLLNPSDQRKYGR
ncbi:MAG: MotA/TolQ/ExbB proton channel family protein [Lentilitoribacter sp.]